MLADQEGALQVDLENAIPVAGLEPMGGASAGHTGGVHHSVQSAVLGRDARDERADGRLVAHVQLGEPGRAGDVRTDHARTVGSKPLDAGLADPRGRSRHQYHPIPESFHRSSPQLEATASG